MSGSRPLDGYCLAGADCEFDLLMRHSPAAVACRLLREEPDQPRQLILALNGEGEDRRGVLRVDDRPFQSLGTEWTPIRVTLRMPRDFGVIDSLAEPPAAALVLQRSYDGCSGSGDGTVATRESNPLPVAILARAPVEPAGHPVLSLPEPG